MSNVYQTIGQIVSCNENSSTKPNYAYIEDLGDGRGYTCGIGGWTTADGDILNIVKLWAPFAMFIPMLQKLSDDGSDSTDELDAHSFKGIWAAACRDQAFTALQDTVFRMEYVDPAVIYMYQMVPSPSYSNLATLMFVDCHIQHGMGNEGDDPNVAQPDSLMDIAQRAHTPYASMSYLENFQRIRRAVLMNPKDHSTKKEWNDSVDRVDAISKIFTARNFDLVTPFEYTVYGDTFKIV